MTLEGLLPLLLGSTGLTVFLLWQNYQQKQELDGLNSDIRAGRLVPRERLDEVRALADRAIDNVDGMADQIAERNRLEAARLQARREEAGLHGSSPLSEELLQTENRMARRPKP